MAGLDALGGGGGMTGAAGQPHDPVLGMLDSAVERMVARGELAADTCVMPAASPATPHHGPTSWRRSRRKPDGA